MASFSLRCPGVAGGPDGRADGRPAGDPRASADGPSSAGEGGCGAPRKLPADGAPAPDCPRCGHRWPSRDGVLVLDERVGEGDYPEALAPLDDVLEDVHWWHASRRDVLGRALRRHGVGAGQRVVDLGCGTGGMLPLAASLGCAVLGVDMSLPALRRARRRTSGPLVRTGRSDVPLTEPVDVVLLCDVLEHAEEARLLADCVALLRPGGLLVVSVPARAALWSTEDVVVGHRRRYDRDGLAAVLGAAGLTVERIQPFHALVGWLAARRRAPLEPPADPLAWLTARRRPPSRRSCRLMGAWQALENRVGAWLPLPGASHLLAVARRPDRRAGPGG